MLSSKHDESSAAVAEATKLLISTIEKLNAAVEKVYDGNAVFVVITVDEHIRSKRQVTPPPAESVRMLNRKLCSIYNDHFFRIINTTWLSWHQRTIQSCSTSCFGSQSSSFSHCSPFHLHWATLRTKTQSSTAWQVLAARRTTKFSPATNSHHWGSPC